jgi:hypothetical protein
VRDLIEALEIVRSALKSVLVVLMGNGPEFQDTLALIETVSLILPVVASARRAEDFVGAISDATKLRIFTAPDDGPNVLRESGANE